jgi:hypothetical protein
LCSSCCDRLERDLGDVASIVADLDVTLSRQAKIGSAGKSGKGWAREKLPIHMGAVEAADVLANTLTTWARDVTEKPAECTCGHENLPAHFHMTPCAIKVAHLARISLDRPLVTNPSHAGARILLSSIPAIRRHPAVVELVDEISDAIRQARHAVDRPADRVYFGACYSETPDEDGRLITCVEEIWASPAATEVTCRVCSVEWSIAERRAWLLKRAEDMLVTVAYASTYLGEIGRITVTQDRIRGYIRREKIAYRAPVEARRFRLGDLLAVVLDESEKAERKAS